MNIAKMVYSDNSYLKLSRIRTSRLNYYSVRLDDSIAWQGSKILLSRFVLIYLLMYSSLPTVGFFKHSSKIYGLMAS